MDGNKIHKRIQKLREKRGDTQKELAEAIEVKRETINQWESGTRALKSDAIVKLSKYFGVSADYLLGITEIETLDTNLQAICTCTGLSEIAARQLIALTFGEGPEILIINHLLGSPAFIDICDKIAYLANLVVEANDNVEEKDYLASFVKSTEDGLRIPHGLSSCEFFESIIVRNLTRQVDSITGLQELREFTEMKRQDQKKLEQEAMDIAREGKSNGVDKKEGN